MFPRVSAPYHRRHGKKVTRHNASKLSRSSSTVASVSTVECRWLFVSSGVIDIIIAMELVCWQLPWDIFVTAHGLSSNQRPAAGSSPQINNSHSCRYKILTYAHIIRSAYSPLLHLV